MSCSRAHLYRAAGHSLPQNFLSGQFLSLTASKHLLWCPTLASTSSIVDHQDRQILLLGFSLATMPTSSAVYRSIHLFFDSQLWVVWAHQSGTTWLWPAALMLTWPTSTAQWHALSSRCEPTSKLLIGFVILVIATQAAKPAHQVLCLLGWVTRKALNFQSHNPVL